MAFTVNAATGASATGPAWKGPLPANAAQQVSNIVGTITASVVFGQPKSHIVPDMFGWRVDRQNAPSGEVNISVQRNDVPSPSTVASVFIPGTLNVAPGTNMVTTQARSRELARALRDGLERSSASRAAALAPPNSFVITRFRVSGTYPS
jgi:hypothetical protein